MEQKLMITSLPQAFKMVKEMNLSTELDSDYREVGRRPCRRFWRGRCGVGLTGTWRRLPAVGRRTGEMGPSRGIC
jgi:hypothetical protein